MKPLIIYKSRTGNTITIAKAVSSILDADLISAEDIAPGELLNRELIGFGSGIYWTRLDRKIYEFAALSPKECNVFVFITHGMGSALMLRLYRHSIKKNFARLNLKLAGTWNCRGFDQNPLFKWMGLSKGHPDADDIKSAEQFAEEMKRYSEK